MAIQGSQAVVYVYELIDGKQKVVQTTFTKSGTEIKKEEKKSVIASPVSATASVSAPEPEEKKAVSNEAPASENDSKQSQEPQKDETEELS